RLRGGAKTRGDCSNETARVAAGRWKRQTPESVAENDRQAAREVLPGTRTVGVAQRAPSVAQRLLDGSSDVFAEREAAGQRAGQRAAGAVIAALQAVAGKGGGAAIARIQTVVHFALVTVTAGDQQMP